MLAAVDGSLDYSEHAAGKMETRTEQTKLGRTIEAVGTSIGTRARINGCELSTSYIPKRSKYLRGPKAETKSVVALLGSAGMEGDLCYLRTKATMIRYTLLPLNTN